MVNARAMSGGGEVRTTGHTRYMGLAMYSWRQTASRRHLAAARARTIGDEVTRTETGVMIYGLFLGWPGTEQTATSVWQ